MLSELIRLIITEPPPASPPTSSAESSPKKEAVTSDEVKKEEEQSKGIVIVDKEAVDALEKDDSAEKNSSDEDEEENSEEAKTDENEEKDTAAVEGSKEDTATAETESTTPAVTTVVDEATRFKYPHIASEILTCEVQQITEKISGDGALLEQLYSFMERGEAPLNPLLSSFFSKAFGILITRKSEQNWYSYQYSCVQVDSQSVMDNYGDHITSRFSFAQVFEFLKQKNFVVDLLRHIGTSAISDLVLRLITCVDGTDIKQARVHMNPSISCIAF